MYLLTLPDSDLLVQVMKGLGTSWRDSIRLLFGSKTRVEDMAWTTVQEYFRQADVERRQSNLKEADSALLLGFTRHVPAPALGLGKGQGKGKGAESQAAAGQGTPSPSSGGGKNDKGSRLKTTRPGSPSRKGSPQRGASSQILVRFFPGCHGPHRVEHCPKAPKGCVPTAAQRKAAHELREAKLAQQQASRRVQAAMASASAVASGSGDTASTSLGAAQGSVL